MKLLIVFFALQIAFSDAMFNSELTDNQPHYAYVTFTGPEQKFYGGGSLISTLHVLTSAVNIRGSNFWEVGLGSNRRSSQQTIAASRAVAHSNFFETGVVRHNDIGIIFLDQPAQLSFLIFPIFLPPINSEPRPFVNVQGMVCGFAGEVTSGNQGLENLQAAHVRTMPFEECQRHYDSVDPSQHFCANDFDQLSNFCLGDQGGALTILTRDVELAVGIASLPGCNLTPSVYIRISAFRDWIFAQTGI